MCGTKRSFLGERLRARILCKGVKRYYIGENFNDINEELRGGE